MPKWPAMVAYGGVFLFIVSLVAFGYKAPSQNQTAPGVADVQANTAQPANITPSVDQVVATSIAANIAAQSNSPIASNVANLSVSLTAESQISQSDTTNSIVKPEIVQPSADNRAIKKYTSKVGDTAETVAAMYNLKTTTIKWANNLATDAIDPGTQLTILPIDGVLYTVKDGDTVQSIASTYQASAQLITSFNDLELTGVKTGQQIVIPNGTLPTDLRPGYVPPTRTSTYTYAGSTSTNGSVVAIGISGAGDRYYAFGNCTAYAYDRRAQLGLPVGNFWGNASTWAINAASAGLVVNHTPAVGAIAQWNAYADGSGYAGHVGIVESVNSDGTITISEMNNYAYGGFDVVDRRTINPNTVSNFIH